MWMSMCTRDGAPFPWVRCAASLVEQEERRRFGKKKLKVGNAKIGKGSFSKVFRASIDGLHTRLAVKQSRIKDTYHRQVMLREVFALRYLGDSAHIVPFVGAKFVAAPHGTTVSLVFARAESDLHTWLETRLSPLGGRMAVCLLRQLFEALSFLHDRCLVHRDIKPRNILVYPGLTGCPDLRLGDLGTCISLRNGLHSQHELVTTLYYRPPEVAWSRMIAETTGAVHGLTRRRTGSMMWPEASLTRLRGIALARLGECGVRVLREDRIGANTRLIVSFRSMDKDFVSDIRLCIDPDTHPGRCRVELRVCAETEVLASKGVDILRYLLEMRTTSVIPESERMIFSIDNPSSLRIQPRPTVDRIARSPYFEGYAGFFSYEQDVFSMGCTAYEVLFGTMYPLYHVKLEKKKNNNKSDICDKELLETVFRVCDTDGSPLIPPCSFFGDKKEGDDTLEDLIKQTAGLRHMCRYSARDCVRVLDHIGI